MRRVQEDYKYSDSTRTLRHELQYFVRAGSAGGGFDRTHGLEALLCSLEQHRKELSELVTGKLDRKELESWELDREELEWSELETERS